MGKRQIDEVDNEFVSISGQDKINAGDFQKFISGFQILNTDLVICNLNPKINLSMELTIDKGRGYVPAEENKKASAALGTIFTDSSNGRKFVFYTFNSNGSNCKSF